MELTLNLERASIMMGGRQTPWVYQDAKGNWHYTRGNKAQPFLKPALNDHADEYREIIKMRLKMRNSRKSFRTPTIVGVADFFLP